MKIHREDGGHEEIEMIYCDNCQASLHCLGELMQDWAEAPEGNFCLPCKLEVLARELAEVRGAYEMVKILDECDSCKDLRARLAIAERERDELRAKFVLAMEALDMFTDGDDYGGSIALAKLNRGTSE